MVAVPLHESARKALIEVGAQTGEELRQARLKSVNGAE